MSTQEKEKRPVPPFEVSEKFHADFVDLTFSYEQLPSLQRECEEWRTAAKEKEAKRQEALERHRVFREMAERLEANGIWERRDVEGLTDYLMEHAEVIASIYEFSKGGGENRVWHDFDDATLSWVWAMHRWYAQIIDGLKATRGAVTVRVPEEVKRYLWVWGLAGIVWRDQQEEQA